MFPCLIVREKGTPARVESITQDDLPAGDVLIQVEYSSINYKDALACQAHPGIVSQLPHVPGIDCAGEVVESNSPDYQPGEKVLVTGYEQGTSHWGGYAAYVRVPADWIVKLPANLTAEEAMILGTAGFTAAQCVSALRHHNILPERGPIMVTGATGGVGSISIALLANLGYEVFAVTGKEAQHAWLQQLGASEILAREEVDDQSGKPLLKSRWAGAIDTVGGNPLSTLLRSMNHRGCVAACGLAASPELPMTVYPFILRGVTLAGIDSAMCPRENRLKIWQLLSGDWKPDLAPLHSQTIKLAEVPKQVEQMLAGNSLGRVLVRPE